MFLGLIADDNPCIIPIVSISFSMIPIYPYIIPNQPRCTPLHSDKQGYKVCYQLDTAPIQKQLDHIYHIIYVYSI